MQPAFQKDGWNECWMDLRVGRFVYFVGEKAAGSHRARGIPTAALWNEFLTRIGWQKAGSVPCRPQGEKTQVAFPLWIYLQNQNQNPVYLLSQGQPPCAGLGHEDSSRETQLSLPGPGNPPAFS